jgi:hypothetical protein
MATANCYVCERGFPNRDVLNVHLAEHPGRTLQEMEEARKSLARLTPIEHKWMQAEAAHNDHAERATEIPGVAINEARAKFENRVKARAVGATALVQPHTPLGADEDDAPAGVDLVDTGLIPTARGALVADAQTWEEHDRLAEAQRMTPGQVAEEFAARHTYDAREIPWAEHTGNLATAERARRNDAAELAVEQERETVLTNLEENPAMTDAEFAEVKRKLVEQRNAESKAQFVAQFPEEARKLGVRAPRLPAESEEAIRQQEADVRRARQRARERGGAPVSEAPITAQFNEPQPRAAATTAQVAARRAQAARASAAAARKRTEARAAREQTNQGEQAHATEGE